MHRYGTKGRGAETWEDYIWYADCENPSKEYQRLFRSRARQLAKREVRAQLEDWYNAENCKS